MLEGEVITDGWQSDAVMEALRQECAAAARLRSAMDEARGD